MEKHCLNITPRIHQLPVKLAATGAGQDHPAVNEDWAGMDGPVNLAPISWDRLVPGPALANPKTPLK